MIADTHFGHKRIIELERKVRQFDSIEEHDEFLIEQWNSVVRPKDTVWHLGDVLFGRDTFKKLGKLNGVKKLVMGNHDVYPTERYLEYFNNVYGAAEVKGCLLTHIPVHPSELHDYRLNIHGHMHSKQLDEDRYVCVSAEQTNLCPVELDKVISFAEATVV